MSAVKMPPSIGVWLLIMMMVSGCAGGFGGFRDTRLLETPGHKLLVDGIKRYEDSEYRVAKKTIQFALEEGLSKDERVKAHKYLAFIACVSGQQGTCREEFAIALELNPKFELDPAEAGHPIWGPVFRTAKSKSAH
jgi:Tfp pilus assembly protein PilF